jgi:tetratricopeptide (TPR) repeat protein
VTEQRAKKDEYQRVLASYAQAVKEFHKGDFEKAAELLEAFIEKHPAEREVVDRAQIYLAIARKRPRKESISLKTFEDYYRTAVVRVNQADYEGALRLLDKALEFKENEGQIYYIMADAYCLMGQPETGLDHLKKAIQKDKSFAVLAQNEPDFEALWEDKRFKLLTKLV